MVEDTIKNIQETVTAEWIGYINQERIMRMLDGLAEQKVNLEETLKELGKLKEFMSNPEHILGSIKTKHGEIAENMQVYLSNSKRLIDGIKASHTFEGVPRTDATDYLRDGVKVQQKFYSDYKRTFCAVEKHLEKYSDYLKNGGVYDIPKDQHRQIMDILKKPSSELTKAEQAFKKLVKAWERKNGCSFEDKIKPAEVGYESVQQGNSEKTINDFEKDIKKKNEENKNNIRNEGKASFSEGAKIAATAAVIEGGLQAGVAIYKKLKEGKRLADFEQDDWKDVGISGLKGAGTGAARGATSYILTNTILKEYGKSAPIVANAYITAAFGIISQADQFRKGNLSEEEFLINSQVVCIDSAISLVGAAIGQVIIPVPGLGAVIGSAVCNVMSSLGKNYLSEKEQNLIEKHNREMGELIAKMDCRYQDLIRKLEEEYKKFTSLEAMAFDANVNIAFIGSIKLAQHVGVKEENILKTKKEVDVYFLN